MTTYSKFTSYVFIMFLVSLIFYRQQGETIFPLFSSVKPGMTVSERDWQRFVELEQLLVTGWQKKDNYRDFGVQLDKIFDETFNYNKALWNYAVNKIQQGLPTHVMHSAKPILECYIKYKNSLELNQERLENMDLYSYLTSERAKHFGVDLSKELFASEFALLTSQLAPNLHITHTETSPLCPLAN